MALAFFGMAGNNMLIIIKRKVNKNHFIDKASPLNFTSCPIVHGGLTIIQHKIQHKYRSTLHNL